MKILSKTCCAFASALIALAAVLMSTPTLAKTKNNNVKVETVTFVKKTPVFVQYSVSVPKGWKTDKIDNEVRFHPPESAGISFEYPPHIRFQALKSKPAGKGGASKNPNGVSMFWDQKNWTYTFQIGDQWYEIAIVECAYPELGLETENLKKAIFSTLKVGPAVGMSKKAP